MCVANVKQTTVIIKCRMKQRGRGKPFKNGQKGYKANLGRKFSEETKKKMSEAHKGHPYHGGMLGKHDSEETRREKSLSMKGKNTKNKDGKPISPINLIIRKSLEYRLWREAVFTRDNWTCVWCGTRSSKGNKVVLNADHIKPFAYYPELRFAIDNGRTLCVPCHKKTDTYGENAKKFSYQGI